jgi:hypothetical protein
MALKARLKCASLSEIEKVLSVVLTDACLRFEAGGLVAKGVDQNHTRLVSINLPSTGFLDYRVTTIHDLGVSLKGLREFLRLCDSEEDVTLELDEEKGRLRLSSGGLSRRMALTDTPFNELKGMSGGDEGMLCKAGISTAALAKGIRAAATVVDAQGVALTSDSSGIMFQSGHEGLDIVQFRVVKEQLSPFDLKGDARSLFEVPFLAEATAAIPSISVTLGFGKDYPITFSFGLCEGQGAAKFLIAPRIEQE